MSNLQATHSALYLSQFLASLARQSQHKFPSRAAEESTLIYNYDVFFTGGSPFLYNSLQLIQALSADPVVCPFESISLLNWSVHN